jgi:hypothetical protein
MDANPRNYFSKGIILSGISEGKGRLGKGITLKLVLKKQNMGVWNVFGQVWV